MRRTTLAYLQTPVLRPVYLTALSVSLILSHSPNVLRVSLVAHSSLSYIQPVPYQCSTTRQQAQYPEVLVFFSLVMASNTMGKSLTSGYRSLEPLLTNT